MSSSGPSRANCRPSMPEVGVIALVPDPWQSPWLSRHQVLSRLSQYFHVTWMFRPKMWANQLTRGLLGKDSSGAMTDMDARCLRFYSGSHLLPIDAVGHFAPPRWRRSIQRQLLKVRLNAAARQLRRLGCRKIVVYLWRPNFAQALDLVDHDLSLYQINDDYSFAFAAGEVQDHEKSLIEAVDLVVIQSPGLMQDKGHLNPNTVFIPNGVNYAPFATPQPEPADIAAIPRPRIGYVGVIKRQLDIALLAGLAEQNPERSFVLIGPKRDLRSEEPLFNQTLARPNVYHLGERPVGTLPAYVQHLDVCAMFYKENDYTDRIYPLKLQEYLATGQPVISSRIRSVLSYQEVVSLASTLEEWQSALDAVLVHEAADATRRQERQAVARAHDWDDVTERIANKVCEASGIQFHRPDDATN